MHRKWQKDTGDRQNIKL